MFCFKIINIEFLGDAITIISQTLKVKQFFKRKLVTHIFASFLNRVSFQFFKERSKLKLFIMKQYALKSFIQYIQTYNDKHLLWIGIMICCFINPRFSVYFYVKISNIQDLIRNQAESSLS